MKTNRLISLLLCLCMVFALFTGFAESASAADDYVAYTIKNGDNLYTLVGKMGMNYGTVKYVIMALNGFTNEAQLSQLQPGQTILLPTSNQAAASLASKALGSSAATATTAVITTTTGNTTAATTTTATSSASTYNGYTPVYYMVQHTVARGENLTSICKALGTNYYDYSSIIMKINNMTSANSLKVGQTVWVPAKTGTAGGTIAVIAYSVKKDDTISGICAQYNTSYANYKDVVKAVNPKIANVEKLNVGQTVYIPVYTSYNNAVAGNPSTAAGTSGSPTTNIATGFAINFTSPSNAAYGTPFAIVGGQANATRAVAGQTVVIRPNAYNGYAVKSIKVVRTDSNAHIQTNDFAFTMPNSNVQVTIEYAQGRTITKKPSANGSFDTLVYGELSTTAFFGDKVEIVPYANDGYEVDKVEVKAGTSTVTAQSHPETGLWYFTMPNSNVDVRVTFKPATTIHLYYNRGIGSLLGSGIVQFYVNGVQVTKANQGDTVRMAIIPADGWVIDKDTTKNGVLGSALDSLGRLTGTVISNPNFDTVNNKFPDSASTTDSYIAVKLSSPTLDDITKINDNIYEFKIPVAGSGNEPTGVTPGDVNVYVGFKQKIPYALLKENISGAVQYGTVTFTVTDAETGAIRKNAEWAYEGDTVEIVPYELQTAASTTTFNTYKYLPTSTSSVLGTDAYTKLYPSGMVMPDASSAGYGWTSAADKGLKFIMPGSIVNVEPRFVQKTTSGLLFPIQIIDNAHGTIEILDAGKKVNQVEPNHSYTIRITADKNYRLLRNAFNGSEANAEYGLLLTDGTWSAAAVAGATVASPSGILSPGYVYATSPASTSWNTSYAGTNIKFEKEEIIGSGVDQRVITTFTVKTGAIADGFSGLAITAAYEEYNVDYTSPSSGTVTTTQVTLNTQNICLGLAGSPFGPGFGGNPSVTLADAFTGVSGDSHVQMYVNGSPASDGVKVDVGAIVGFVFTVNDGYRLVKVEKNVTSGDGFDQVLSPVDGIYWYTITEQDASGTNPAIRFEVTTEPIVKIVEDKILYSCIGNTGEKFTIENLGPSDVWGSAQDINAGDFGEYSASTTPNSVVAGDTIKIAIEDSMFGAKRTLASVTIGDTNLTMGDLTHSGTEWVYQFKMPDRDVKVQVVFKDVELMNP